MGGLCHELQLGKKFSSRKVLLCLAIFIISILVDNNNVLCQEKKAAKASTKTKTAKTTKTIKKSDARKSKTDEFVPISHIGENGEEYFGTRNMFSRGINYKGEIYDNCVFDDSNRPYPSLIGLIPNFTDLNERNSYIKNQYMVDEKQVFHLDFVNFDDDLDTPYLREHASNIYMTQWEANDPVEDRCLVTLIDLNEIELKPLKTTYEPRKSTQEMFIEHVDQYVSEKLEKFINSYKEKVKTNVPLPSHYTLADDADIFYNNDSYEPLSSDASSSSNADSSSGANTNTADVFDLKDNQYLFTSVMDGHGGPTMAEILRKWLPAYVKKHLMTKLLNGKIKPRDIVSSIEAAHLEFDHDVLQVTLNFKNTIYNYSPSGSCALSILMDKHSYYVSNVGDSKSLLLRPDEFVVLNNVHNIAEPMEKEKLIKEHPNDKKLILARLGRDNVVYPSIDQSQVPTTKQVGPLELYRPSRKNATYIKGLLQCTRSFGDYFLKYEDFAVKYMKTLDSFQKPYSFPYITSRPEVFALRRSKNDKYLVLASDGVTTDLSDFNIHDIISNYNFSLEDASKLLIGAAIENHSSYASFHRIDMMGFNAKKRSYHDDSTVVLLKLF
ncbi:protein phosphatase PPM8, putative [Plasmodium vinckei brucechwatti]|uniref:Protein phosphatase PPM8, putative n=1 Tax=Plasmodium vinckei brucechwatti TaxID=119398 RepID=A0A6V7S602_PLAVN|nr:protein phosphatase PPM8, putative [Plasmodium vinckei brucechwatti]